MNRGIPECVAPGRVIAAGLLDWKRRRDRQQRELWAAQVVSATREAIVRAGRAAARLALRNFIEARGRRWELSDG